MHSEANKASARVSAEKFPGEGQTEKRQKNSKKDQKIALLSLFQESSNRKKDQNWQKRPKTALLKRYYTLFLII